ncbi:MAG: Fur family transcriptional regulator [Alphaproteobacteria bacterium]|tara:strand:- start:27 stop:440 length:414 start_codon:yes stop_codon:yes gene_type:complete
MTGNSHIQKALEMLENSPLKLTSQRVSLIKTLFKEGNQHFSAEDVYNKVKNTGVRISLATIYNCLNQFTTHGILKMVKASSDKVYFDTNLKSHHHFFCKTSSELTDIDAKKVRISKLPKIPQGKRLNSIEVIVNISD